MINVFLGWQLRGCRLSEKDTAHIALSKFHEKTGLFEFSWRRWRRPTVKMRKCDDDILWYERELGMGRFAELFLLACMALCFLLCGAHCKSVSRDPHPTVHQNDASDADHARQQSTVE